jgi:uncharacterized membrane protein YsdA (DUF1294 family)
MLRHFPFLGCLILTAVGLVKLSSEIPWQFILSYILIVSITTYLGYWLDKRRAKKDLWRIPEKSMHLLALLGGWPAAYLAQQIHRHKTSKRSFRVVFWCIVGLYQILALEHLFGGRITKALISSV